MKNEENKLSKEENGSFREKMSLKFRKKLITNKTNTLLLVVCLIVIFIALNLWAQSKELSQIDVTENKIYSLTQTSKDELANLNKEINIYIYGLDENSSYVEFVKQYAAYNSNIKYEIVSIETNYEIVTKYDLNNLEYNAIVVACGEKDIILYPDYEFTSSEYVNGSYEDVDLTEECITNAILNVITDDPIKIYFTTGNGEYTTNEVSTLIALLEAQVYECEELNLLSVTEIPEDCDILTILQPASDISVGTAEVLKNYINKGGNVFLAMIKANPDENFENLQSVLDLYGVSIDYGVLYEGNSNNFLAYQQNYYPYILMPNFSSASDITSNLKNSGYTTVLPWAQKLTISNVEEENVVVSNQELIYTSNKCYPITEINNGFDPTGVEPGAFTIAGKFIREKTNPATEIEESTSITSNLIIIGNALFLADNDDNLLPTPISWQANANFALNCFADLAEQDNLITARKPSHVTTFTSTSKQDFIVKLIIFGVPVLIIIIGIIVWNVRRRKR